jgi:hypothetical protein
MDIFSQSEFRAYGPGANIQRFASAGFTRKNAESPFAFRG